MRLKYKTKRGRTHEYARYGNERRFCTECFHSRKRQAHIGGGKQRLLPRLFSELLYTSFQLIFLDHRGFVEPPRTLEPEDYTLNKVLDDIERARQALGLENFIILGHSGHAFMALAYAKKYPEHVRKVILLNTAPTNSPERQQQSFAFSMRRQALSGNGSSKRISPCWRRISERSLNVGLLICAFGWEPTAFMIMPMMRLGCGRGSSPACPSWIIYGEKPSRG